MSGGRRGSREEFASALEGMGEGEFIGELESGTGGQAVGESGDADAGRGETFGEVIGGGITFDVGAEGEDDFADGAGGQAGFELGDSEVVGLDATEGG
jgi:hypothetical protein